METQSRPQPEGEALIGGKRRRSWRNSGLGQLVRVAEEKERAPRAAEPARDCQLRVSQQAVCSLTACGAEAPPAPQPRASMRFGLAVHNGAVNLEDGFPYISVCGDSPPQSCLFSQVLNLAAATAAWICILRYHQLQDWGVKKWRNQVILCAGLLCALGTSVVGNFQHRHQWPVHQAGSFLTFVMGALYFWLQLALLRGARSPPQPGAPWVGPLRLGLCSLCTALEAAMVALRLCQLRSASAACEWAAAMLLFGLFGLLSADFAGLGGCSLSLRPAPGLPPPRGLVAEECGPGAPRPWGAGCCLSAPVRGLGLCPALPSGPSPAPRATQEA
ncbi:PREDICTED: transmembrane protein 150B [Condylura cristata]|uniref:transmembrane protein 150B n=1 Tax=Condylura cristata TaxID=143302 RepID=UPI0006431C8B|nr:PREDICTED: transmembrane protein 150B [Condylura cristata]